MNSEKLCPICNLPIEGHLKGFNGGPCKKCGRRVCSSCLCQVSNDGYWDEISRRYSEVGLWPELCKDCYEEERLGLRARWEREFMDEESPYHSREDNPY